jgi:rare lipoprotein A
MMMRIVLLAALCLIATGCATGRPAGPATSLPPSAPVREAPTARPPAPPRPAPGTMTGLASWYGQAHHGKKTSSGEVYDRTQLTAAHRTLPMGTRVRVTNVENDRSVVVRINDRGPFKAGRIIDLSQAAAREIGALGEGLFSVRLEVLEDAASEPAPTTGSR